MLATAISALPMVVTATCLVLVILGVRAFLIRRYDQFSDQQMKIHVVLLVLTAAAIPIVIVTLPVSETQQGQLLSLIGLLFSAAIALSATTFLGNALAGLMLRSVGSFHLGDFVRIGDHFGRVSARGLFHVEIQTEARDLTTLPNLYLVTNPVRVIRTSGTIISADLSLGYDVPRLHVETLLTQAASAADLGDPFVLVIELGDFSVTYRVAGLLTDVKNLLSARSRLQQMVLDKLHEGGVEIVSPTFMQTRVIPEGRLFIPKSEQATCELPAAAPEQVIFDKAETAAKAQEAELEHESLGKTIEELREQSESVVDMPEAAPILEEIRQLEARREALERVIEEHRQTAQKKKPRGEQDGGISNSGK